MIAFKSAARGASLSSETKRDAWSTVILGRVHIAKDWCFSMKKLLTKSSG